MWNYQSCDYKTMSNKHPLPNMLPSNQLPTHTCAITISYSCISPCLVFCETINVMSAPNLDAAIVYATKISLCHYGLQ